VNNGTFADQARVLIVGLLLCLSATSNAATSSQLRARGKVLLQENCGRCHAIGAIGRSRLKGATPMRDVYAQASEPLHDLKAVVVHIVPLGGLDVVPGESV
jgi:mono/diheme cytochrome c family protein